jgi:hypothetical protein
MKNANLILIGGANELKPVNNVLKIPFGSYDHPLGLQVFGLAEAQSCVESFNELAKVPGFRGLPVYIGHPDVKGFQDKYRDHSAYGWIAAMTANEAEGRLDLAVQWNGPGAALVANEQFAYFSPLWLNARRGTRLHPVALKSVGLTQEPNIQYLAVACEMAGDEATNQGVPMDLKKLRDWLASRWKHETALESAPNELVIEEAIALLDAREAELATHAAALATANEAVPEAVAATLAQVQAELETANESVQAIRAAHSGLLLDVALSDGRITPATRVKWEERFAANFDATANELALIDPAMKTKSVTKAAKPADGTAGPGAAEARRAALVVAANEVSAANPGLKPEQVWAKMRKMEQYAGLFAPAKP